MTIRGLQRLLMILGGKVAAEFREIVERTFTRAMAGDQSLIEVAGSRAAGVSQGSGTGTRCACVGRVLPLVGFRV
jgi:hypothetical protein